jgi:hypothetical protein
MEDSAMAELAHKDVVVVKNLGLSFQEAALLCDAFNGLTLQLDDGQFPWATVEYVIFMDKLDRKWTVNAHALVGRLRALGGETSLALERVVSTFWEQREAPTPLRMRAAGLTR